MSSRPFTTSNKTNATVYGLCLAVAMLACHPQPKALTQLSSKNEHQQKRLQHYNQTVYAGATHHIEDGDIILRLGSDITSEMFRQMNKTDQRYSHVGIASVEQDSIFVYHAIGGEFNPDQKIKRELLYSFGYPSDNKALAILRVRSSRQHCKRIAATAKSLFLQGIPFDMKFDYTTNDRLYCSEFVAKCIVRSIQDSSWLQFTQTGPLKFVAVDNLALASIMQQHLSWNY